RDAVIENIILLDPIGWTMQLSGSENIQVSNTRVIGWRANSDGLDIEHSSKVRVDGCFWRTNDDCIAIKAIYPPGVQGVPFEEMINPETLGGHLIPRRAGDWMGDIDIRNCVLWNERGGQGFEIGFELRIDHIRNIIFRDSDIIHVNGGAFSIHNGDRAVIENFTVENVRIENPDRFIDFHVGLSIYSDDCPPPYRRSNPKRVPPPDGFRPERANNPWQWYVPAAEDTEKHEANRGLVRNIILRDIQLLKAPKSGSILYGYSEDRGISDVLIEGMTIADKPVLSADEIDLYQRHVRNLRFRPAR
ncbi:MAG TPA: glycosyl hydrolase family 28 protein, partial [Luteolibacter sp.]|nr:glycosyl hydrolase family 28 protein [Luteolibacter sp.]